MSELVGLVASWHSVLLVTGVFGFAPGFVLRLLVKVYPRADPRRRELVAELYAHKWIERPLWVAEQLETVLFEGLPHRFTAVHVQMMRRQRRIEMLRDQIRDREPDEWFGTLGSHTWSLLEWMVGDMDNSLLPVCVECGDWDSGSGSLLDFVAGEMALTWHSSVPISRALLDSDRDIVLVIDGLDESRLELDCAAFTALRQEWACRPVLFTTRKRDGTLACSPGAPAILDH
jgi:hypothetical protein